eukprot:COSAG02_NODE_2387_length_8986_cov_12.395184_1_plen_118_part_00
MNMSIRRLTLALAVACIIMCRYFEAHCGLVVIKDQLYRHDLQTAGDMQRLRSAVSCSGTLHHVILCKPSAFRRLGLLFLAFAPLLSHIWRCRRGNWTSASAEEAGVIRPSRDSHLAP